MSSRNPPLTYGSRQSPAQDPYRRRRSLDNRGGNVHQAQQQSASVRHASHGDTRRKRFDDGRPEAQDPHGHEGRDRRPARSPAPDPQRERERERRHCAQRRTGARNDNTPGFRETMRNGMGFLAAVGVATAGLLTWDRFKNKHKERNQEPRRSERRDRSSGGHRDGLLR